MVTTHTQILVQVTHYVMFSDPLMLSSLLITMFRPRRGHYTKILPITQYLWAFVMNVMNWLNVSVLCSLDIMHITMWSIPLGFIRLYRRRERRKPEENLCVSVEVQGDDFLGYRHHWGNLRAGGGGHCHFRIPQLHGPNLGREVRRGVRRWWTILLLHTMLMYALQIVRSRDN